MNDDLIAKVQKDVTDEQKYRDGIPQIAVGVFLVITMLLMMSGNGNTFVVLIPLMPIVIEALRKRITYPRIGYAKVKESKVGAKPTLWVIFAILLAGAAIILIRTLNPEALPEARNPHFLMMWAVGILIVLFGVIFLNKRHSKRLTLSLVAVVAMIAAMFFFRLQKAVVYKVILAFGAIQVLAGLYNLRSFIKEYPVLKDDE